MSTFVLAALAACLGPGVRADVVEMTDGRRFEGEIVGQDAVSVSIDTRVTPTIRTTLRLERADIASVEPKPLPPGFFDPPPVPSQRSDRREHATGDTLYLEIPIEGRFGEDIFESGVRDALRYAGRYRIDHIVFVVDCDGGEPDDVSATWDVLRSNRRQFSYHAVVRKCLGGALAIPIWCDSIFIAPGARIGGSPDLRETPPDASRVTEDGIMLAQIANDVVRQAQLTGHAEQIVRAMIDPARILACWRDEDGEIAIAANPPQDLPPDRLIFESDMGTALVLDHEQALELGLEGFSGDIAGLGEVLGLEGWKRESDYGREAMDEAGARRRAEAEKAEAKFNAQVENNIRRREVLERNLEENLKRAAEWNPTNASYDFYSRRWGWGWGRRGRGGMTSDSQRRWTRRTDLSLSYLLAAAETVIAIERLDREAVKLGVEPSFDGNDLGWIKSDIQTKYDELMADRRRRA